MAKESSTIVQVGVSADISGSQDALPLIDTENVVSSTAAWTSIEGHTPDAAGIGCDASDEPMAAIGGASNQKYVGSVRVPLVVSSAVKVTSTTPLAEPVSVVVSPCEALRDAAPEVPVVTSRTLHSSRPISPSGS